jgi:hypothetical protein
MMSVEAAALGKDMVLNSERGSSSRVTGVGWKGVDEVRREEYADGSGCITMVVADFLELFREVFCNWVPLVGIVCDEDWRTTVPEIIVSVLD